MPATIAPQKFIILFLATLSFVFSGCSLLGEQTFETVQAPTVTPPGDMLQLQAEQFQITLEEGVSVPGTNLVYQTTEGENIIMEIDGQRSVRRVGDFLTGSNIIVPGVHVRYNLRLMSAAFSNPRLIGPVTATVFNPTPVELLGMTDPPPAKIVYEGINIDYRVPVGRALPGSSVVYRGVDANGNGASLTGTAQYAVLPEQNSFVWTGQLTPNAIIQYDLKAVSITSEEMQMRGTAKLFLYQSPPDFSQ